MAQPNRQRRAFLKGTLTLSLVLNPAVTARAAISSSKDVSRRSIYAQDYSPIADFTEAFCRSRGNRTLIDFIAIRQQGLGFLAGYLRELGATRVDALSDDHQLAHWLNTRNLLVVEVIARTGSHQKLRKQRGTFSSPGPLWLDKRLATTEGKLSINDIEKQKILANHSAHPHILYGLYQGTRGGPKLPLAGFTPADVHKELDALGRIYLNSTNEVKKAGASVSIPAVYKAYFQSVFRGSYGALIDHIAPLADTTTAKLLAKSKTPKFQTFKFGSDGFALRKQMAPVVDFDT